MSDFEALAKEFFLEEAILETIVLDNAVDLYLALEVWKGNATLDFDGDFDFRFPQERLVLKCGRFVHFNIDRISAYGTLDLLMSDGQQTTTEWLKTRRTITSWGFLNESENLSRLGEHASKFRHLVFDTYTAKFDLVFESLQMMNSLPDTVSGPPLVSS